MLGAKYDYNQARERRAGVDDMVNIRKTTVQESLISFHFHLGLHVKKHGFRNQSQSQNSL